MVAPILSPQPARTPILLHAHLFKNAGSSLDWALARSFGGAFLDHRDDHAMRGNPAYLNAFVDEHPGLAALSSHWLPLPAGSTEKREVHAIVLLRDPILRLRSVYDFERRQDVDHAGTRKAREAGLADYVAWRLEPETGPVIRNYQTRVLSGTFPGDDDDQQLSAALDTVESLAFAGLVERYDESMVLLEALLGPHFPNLDLAYIAQNTTAPHDETKTPAVRRAEIEEELGSLARRACEANGRDQRLYERIAARFEAHWSSLSDRSERLAEFQRRCRALAV